MDELEMFLKTRCVERDRARIGATDLYLVYVDWAERVYKVRPMSQRAFGMAIVDAGIGRYRSGGRVFYRGVELRIELGLESENEAGEGLV